MSLTSLALTSVAFAPFGDVIDATGPPDRLINEGRCGRYHDLAQFDVEDGRLGLSLFKAEPRTLPIPLPMVERHPQGSQAFVPMGPEPFFVVVAPDQAGLPGTPLVFLTRPGQGVHYHRGVWHGVLCPLAEPGLFAVMDRIGPGPNLEEHWFETPYQIVA